MNQNEFEPDFDRLRSASFPVELGCACLARCSCSCSNVVSDVSFGWQVRCRALGLSETEEAVAYAKEKGGDRMKVRLNRKLPWVLLLLLHLISIPLFTLNPLPFYFCMMLDGVIVDLKLYWRISRKTRGWQPFSLRVVGGLCEVSGFFLLVIGISGMVMSTDPVRGVFLFPTLLAVGLLGIGASLILRFKMRSGIIIYRG